MAEHATCRRSGKHEYPIRVLQNRAAVRLVATGAAALRPRCVRIIYSLLRQSSARIQSRSLRRGCLCSHAAVQRPPLAGVEVQLACLARGRDYGSMLGLGSFCLLLYLLLVVCSMATAFAVMSDSKDGTRTGTATNGGPLRFGNLGSCSSLRIVHWDGRSC
jgi:hypothetical protein